MRILEGIEDPTAGGIAVDAQALSDGPDPDDFGIRGPVRTGVGTSFSARTTTDSDNDLGDNQSDAHSGLAHISAFRQDGAWRLQIAEAWANARPDTTPEPGSDNRTAAVAIGTFFHQGVIAKRVMSAPAENSADGGGSGLDGALFTRGDSNGDARFDISDAVHVVNWLFLGGPTSPCLDAADANDDGRLDLSDTISIVGFLFQGGPAPRMPFPDCGADPSADALSCLAAPEGCGEPPGPFSVALADGETDVRGSSVAALLWSLSAFRLEELEGGLVRVLPPVNRLELFHSFLELSSSGRHRQPLLGGLLEGSLADALLENALSDIEASVNESLGTQPPSGAEGVDFTLTGAAAVFKIAELSRGQKSDRQLVEEYLMSSAVSFEAPASAQEGFEPRLTTRAPLGGAHGLGQSPALDEVPGFGRYQDLDNMVGLLVEAEGSLLEAMNLAAATPGSALSGVLSGASAGEEVTIEMSFSESAELSAESENTASPLASEISMTALDAAPGFTVPIAGRVLVGTPPYSGVLRSFGRPFGQTILSQDGAFEATVQVPNTQPAGSYEYTVELRDAALRRISAMSTFTVTAPAPLSVQVAFPGRGLAGQSVFVLAGARGGLAPYTLTWTLPWRALAAAEDFSGTVGGLVEIPRTLPAGVYPTAVQVSDASGQEAAAQASFVVVAPQSSGPVTFTQLMASAGEAGGVVTVSGSVAGGVGPYTVTVAHPWGSGLASVSGSAFQLGVAVPATASGGVYFFSVTVRDSAGGAAELRGAIQVNSGVVEFPPSPLRLLRSFVLEGAPASTVTVPVTVSGGVGPYTVTVQHPWGQQSVTTAGGAVSVPVQVPAGTQGGDYLYVVRVRDSRGSSEVASGSIAVHF
jgi:hypothetical protein